MSELISDTATTSDISTKPTSKPSLVKMIFSPEKVSAWRYGLAMVVAALADTVGVLPGELGAVVVDLFVGLLLAACLGFQPFLLFAFVIEALPIVGVFPTWLVAVPAIWAHSKFMKRD